MSKEKKNMVTTIQSLREKSQKENYFVLDGSASTVELVNIFHCFLVINLCLHISLSHI